MQTDVRLNKQTNKQQQQQKKQHNKNMTLVHLVVGVSLTGERRCPLHAEKDVM